MSLDTCMICSRILEDGFLCEDCWRQISREFFNEGLPRCEKCYSLLPFEGFNCRFCLGHPGIKISVMSPYAGFSRKVIETYKFGCKKELSSIVARVLDVGISRLGLEGDIRIVPVPSSKKGLKKRKFDQMLLVAKAMDYPFTTALKRIENTQHKALNREQRIKEMGNMFLLIKDLKDCPEKNIVVIDDICTTGTTLISAINILKTTGKNVVGLAWLGSQDRV